jgi:hypothetical protein
MNVVTRRSSMWGLALVVVLSLGGRLFAAEPEPAQVTFSDDTRKDVSVTGFGAAATPNVGLPTVSGKDKEGAAFTVAMDKMAVIKGTTKESVLIVLRNGEEHRLTFGGELLLHYQTEGGAAAKISLANVKEVRFLYPLRKDKKGNAMLPGWLYSPFTGEKLPEQK